MSHLIHEPITTAVREFGNFSDEELALFRSKLTQKKLLKNEFLLKEGQVCQSIWFITNGSIRQFYCDEEAQEITVDLQIEMDWVLDQQSFLSQKPSKLHVQAFENSELWELTVQALHELISLSPSFFRLGKLLQKDFVHSEQKQAPPQVKYLSLMQTKPLIIQRFPLKYIASYLRMTPETLSRVRNRIK